MSDKDAELISDYELAMKLLAGFDSNNPKADPRYPKGADEHAARAALAREVRRNMPGLVGELLALAIDPISRPKIPGMKPLRHVRFESVRRGKVSTWARDQLVIDFIGRYRFNWNAPKKGERLDDPKRYKKFKLDAALEAAVKEFGISRSRAHEIWQTHEKMIEAQSGK